MKTLYLNRNFKLLVFGQLISLLGNSIQKFALSIYILDLTGSASLFSILLSICILPQVLISPFGGAIADCVSKKKMLVFLDLASALVLILFSFFFYSNKIQLISIAIFMLVLSVLGSLYDPVVRAVLPAVVPPDDYMNANSIISAVSSITILGGPVCAGFLYSILGIKFIFLINLISFLLSAFLEFLLSFPPSFFQIQPLKCLTILLDMKKSIIFLYKEQKMILYILFLSAAVNLLLTPIYTIGISNILKLFFRISNQTFGIASGIIGFGMIVGALFVSFLNKKIPFTKMHFYFIFLGLIVLGMGVCTTPLFSTSRTALQFACTLFTLLGFFFSVTITITNISFFTILQKETPIHMMGKIMAIVTSVSAAFMPIGQISYGFLFEKYAHHVYFIYVFAAAFTFALSVVLYKILRKCDIYESIQPES